MEQQGTWKDFMEVLACTDNKAKSDARQGAKTKRRQKV